MKEGFVMSDENYDTEPADILRASTKEQLNDILHNELMSDEKNVEQIKRVNQALKAKSGEKTEFDVNANWQELKSDYVGTEPLYDITEEFVDGQAYKPPAPGKFRPPIGVAVAIIAVIVLMSGTFTAYALGYDVFGAIVTWTKETFGSTQQAEAAPSAEVPSSDLSKLSELQSALDEYGITEKLAPTYIPKGFEQTEFHVEEADVSTFFASVLENEDDTIIIQIRQFSVAANGAEYEKDDGDPEIYVVNNISHYIMTNMGKYHAVWKNGMFEVSISGLNTKEELVKMIESIYGR